MRTSTARPLIYALTASLGVLFPWPLSAADIEIIVRFGESEPASELRNVQPPDAVTSVQRSDGAFTLRLGVGVGAPTGHIVSFSTGGLIVEQGVLVEANFREVFSLGRLTRVNGVSAGGEATAVDLQVAATLATPSGLDQPLVVTLPLAIATTSTVSFPDGTIWATEIQVSFPTTFPSVEFTAGGTRYKLRLIGFGSIGPDGTVTTVSSLVNDPVQSADLLAVIESPCLDDPDSVTAVLEVISDFAPCGPTSLGGRIVRYGSFGWTDVLEANSGDRLELECVNTSIAPPPVMAPSASYKLFFTKSGSTQRLRVGFCPFELGCNAAWFWHSGDNDNGGLGDGKPDCFLQVQWISKDYGDNDTVLGFNPWTKQLEFPDEILDWAETFYDATSGSHTKMDHKYHYNVGPPVTTACHMSGALPPAQKPEGAYIGTTLVDPPLGPQTEAFYDEVEALFARVTPRGAPMAEDRLKHCDFNGDGACDGADAQIFDGSLGSCRNDATYRPQADIDASGCVDARDRFHLFEADRDGDGIPDTADNCLTAANPGQIDSDNDGEGDACESGVAGDFDNDGDVDRTDLDILLDWRNTVAAGPNDPKDLDRDGRITVLDARKVVLLCTKLNCATE